MSGHHVAWFRRDDEGYYDWLRGHPDGYVVATWIPITVGEPILHHAACWHINHDIRPKSWTHKMGKACSDERAAAIAWVQPQADHRVRPCAHCRP